MKIEIECSILNGKLELNREQLQALISNCRDGTYILNLESLLKDESSYRKFYFKYLSIISEHLGYTTQELHESFRAEYLAGESTKELGVVQWKWYLESIKDWAYKFGDVILP